MTHKLINSKEIIRLHDRFVSQPTQEWRLSGNDGLRNHIEQNHFFNASLWAEEDQARRTDVHDSEIAKNKRLIDKFNQARNDMIERIDEDILSQFKEIDFSDARLNSETAGSMIDRLSILSLKIYHMGIQANRESADQNHRDACSKKQETLRVQRHNLALCFDQLIHELSSGKSKYYIYHQFKMYNDPSLNPYLYQKT